MWFTAILAAVLLALPSLHDGAEPSRASGSETNQDTPTNPQASNPEPVPAAPQQSESAPDQKTPAKEAGKPTPEKPASKASKATGHKRRSRTHKSAAPTDDGQPRKVVIRHGGASDAVAQI